MTHTPAANWHINNPAWFSWRGTRSHLRNLLSASTFCLTVSTVWHGTRRRFHTCSPDEFLMALSVQYFVILLLYEAGVPHILKWSVSVLIKVIVEDCFQPRVRTMSCRFSALRERVPQCSAVLWFTDRMFMLQLPFKSGSGLTTFPFLERRRKERSRSFTVSSKLGANILWIAERLVCWG